MPRFSIVVPAYKVQAFLHECLESVLSQSFTDFEVIAVDDASPDACGQIIDEFAERDSRVRPYHLPRNAGLGGARNAALEQARGDYVLFLDSDDTLVPGSLAAIADRLAAVGEVDVLLYDYARTYWNGRRIRNERAAVLAPRDPAVFTVHERPEVLRLLTVVWNKAFRRGYLERLSLRFETGYYEDVAFSYPALLAAERIACLDRVCVHYRQRREGSILRTRSRRHFDLFDQYDRVLAFAAARPDLTALQPLLYTRMVDHICAVLNMPGRLPSGDRREFFKRGHTMARRHRPAGYTPPSGAAGVRHRLLDAGTPSLYQVLLRSRRAFLAARRRAHRARRALASGADLVHYRLQRLRPLDEHLAVFTAQPHGHYTGDPAAIEAKLRELAPHIRTAWVAGAEHASGLPEEVERLEPGSLRHLAVLARAKYFVDDADFTDGTDFPGPSGRGPRTAAGGPALPDAPVAKRPGTVHVQTHRGSPLAAVGLDLQDRPGVAAGADFAAMLRRCDRWDYSLSGNRHSTLVRERAYPAKFTTLETGRPRTDAFHRPTEEHTALLRERLGIPAGATAVLYAPAHRPHVRGFAPRFDLERFCQTLGESFVLLVRPHPRSSARAEVSGLAGKGLAVDVSAHPSVEELCLASDALLTDYSSLMFDYASLDRPIVLHTDDWEVFRSVRGAYVDIVADPPGVVSRSEEQLIEAFASGAWCGPGAAALRAAFRERYCPLDDGHAAERVVRQVFLGDRSTVPAARSSDSPMPARGCGPGRAGNTVIPPDRREARALPCD